MITTGNVQSSAGKNNNINSKNIHKLLQQDTSANISNMADPSLSTELPDKHLSLQMETLPEGFQRSDFLLDKGAIDMIIDRREMRNEISGLLFKLSG